MVVVSIVVLILAVVLGQGCRPGWAPGTEPCSGATAIVVLGIVMALLPALGELSTNVAESGSRLTETPQPVTDPSGKTCTRGSGRSP